MVPQIILRVKNHLLIRLNAYSLRWNPYLTLLNSQQSVTRLVIDLRGKPSTTILPKEHSYKKRLLI